MTHGSNEFGDTGNESVFNMLCISLHLKSVGAAKAQWVDGFPGACKQLRDKNPNPGAQGWFPHPLHLRKD